MTLPKKTLLNLKRAGIFTISDLLEKIESIDELFKLKGIGKKTGNDIVDKIHNLGFEFKKEKVRDEEGCIRKDISLTQTLFPKKVCDYLRIAGIETIEDLLDKIRTLKAFSKIRGIGDKTRDEIIAEMHKLGFKFKWEENLNLKLENDKSSKTNINIESVNLQEFADNTYIYEIIDNTKIVNALFKEGIIKLSDLTQKLDSLDDMLKIKNIGIKSQKEIIDKIHSLGLEFICERQIRKNGMDESATKIREKNVKFAKTKEEYVDLDSDLDTIKQKIQTLNMQKQQVIKVIEQLLNNINAVSPSKEDYTPRSEEVVSIAKSFLEDQIENLRYLENKINELLEKGKDIKKVKSERSNNQIMER